MYSLKKEDNFTTKDKLLQINQKSKKLKKEKEKPKYNRVEKLHRFTKVSDTISENVSDGKTKVLNTMPLQALVKNFLNKKPETLNQMRQSHTKARQSGDFKNPLKNWSFLTKGEELAM